MKRKIYLLLGVAVVTCGLFFTSCSDYLNVEKHFRDTQSEDKIFADDTYTLQWLAYCYCRLQGVM